MPNFSSLLALSFLSILAAVYTPLTVAAPTTSIGASFLPSCFPWQVDNRKEWRQLTALQKSSYINSVLCLQSKPPRNTGGTAKSRFEEFQEAHIKMTPTIHVVGQFLPWHRHFVTLYTNALRSECGYFGPTPYWDWTIEGDSTRPLAQLPIFDAKTGFGGDGVPGTYTLPKDPTGINNTPPPFRPWDWKGCVQDGPFAGKTFHLGPHLLNTDHCLVRSLDESYKKNVNSASVAAVMATTSFSGLSAVMENLETGMHPGGHWLVSGELGDPYSSPGDPLFYLHHAQLDRVW